MLQNLVRSLCRNGNGVILVAGAIGLLSGVQQLFSGRTKHLRQASRSTHQKSFPVDRFRIRRTQSELGYTYWVVQGYGKYRGFALFDSWQEAMDEVRRRTSSPVNRNSAIPGDRVTV